VVITVSRSQQFDGKPKHHECDNDDIHSSAEPHRQDDHEQSDKVEVYHVSVAVVGWVSKQR